MGASGLGTGSNPALVKGGDGALAIAGVTATARMGVDRASGAGTGISIVPVRLRAMGFWVSSGVS